MGQTGLILGEFLGRSGIAGWRNQCEDPGTLGPRSPTLTASVTGKWWHCVLSHSGCEVGWGATQRDAANNSACQVARGTFPPTVEATWNMTAHCLSPSSPGHLSGSPDRWLCKQSYKRTTPTKEVSFFQCWIRSLTSSSLFLPLYFQGGKRSESVAGSAAWHRTVPWGRIQRWLIAPHFGEQQKGTRGQHSSTKQRLEKETSGPVMPSVISPLGWKCWVLGP